MLKQWHRLLSMQMRRLGLDLGQAPDLAGWQSFIERIDRSYAEADAARTRLERSLMVVSEEMEELYTRLQQSTEARLTAITQALPDILLLLDEDGTYLQLLNPNYWYQNDRSRASIGDVNTLKHLTEHAHDDLMRAIERSFKEHAQQQFEFSNSSGPDAHHFEVRVQPLNRVEKDKRMVIVLIRDITDKKRAERELQLVQIVYQTTQEGMLITDQDLKIISTNPAFRKISGINGSSLRHCSIDELGITAEVGFFNSLLSKVEDSQHWQGEVMGRRVDGQTYPMLLSFSKVMAADGDACNYVVMLADISEVKKSQEELEYVATHDPLTGLPNRVLFQDRLNQSVARAEYTRSVGALLFLDLDRFKVVNDNLGHHKGDELLCQVSERIKSVCHPGQSLARLGGDEFTIIAENVRDAKSAAELAKKVLAAFSEPFELDHYKLQISASIGISLFPKDSNNGPELVQQADTAMYSVKERGRNGYQFFTRELTEDAFQYFALEVTLSEALKNQELFLEYQPQYSLSSGHLTGMEALVRWNHSELGLLWPDRFIPLAEMTGLIEPLGEWVIRKACHQLASWRDSGIKLVPVAINLSPRQLGKLGLADTISGIIEENGVQANLLEFEVTESAIFEREDIAYSNLREIQALGCRLSIDDFGTGYSSLANLKRFSFDRLKIDRTFIRDATMDPNDDAIIRATIALGATLGMEVIAEGVETVEQLEFLKAEGCPEVQGFFCGRPISEREIAAFLEASHKLQLPDE